MNNKKVYSLAVNGNNIFAGTNGNGVYLSTNNGTNWIAINNGLTNNVIYSLEVSGNNIFAGTGGEGVYLSTNNGTNWVQTALNNKSVYSLTVNGNNIFAGTADSGVFFSTNNGISWATKNQGFNGITSAYSLLITDTYIFSGIFGKSIWRRELSEITETKNINTEIPLGYSLSQNYPNPFNLVTKIRFEVPLSKGLRASEEVELKGVVSLKIFDITGREIKTLVNEQLQPGTYEVTFDGSNLPSGVYFYQLRSGEFAETKKLVLLK